MSSPTRQQQSEPPAFQSQAPAGPLHAFHLRADGLLVESRPGGLQFTRLCERHEIASLTVGDERLLAGWTCSGCEDIRQSNHARARYVAALARLEIGRR
jgi:hypothetical protein